MGSVKLATDHCPSATSKRTGPTNTSEMVSATTKLTGPGVSTAERSEPPAKTGAS
jgi:hypothetical protein